MTLTRISVIFLLFFLCLSRIFADTRYFIKVRSGEEPRPKLSDNSREKSRAIIRLDNNRNDDESMIRETLKANQDRRNSFGETSTFDPEVLNKFLDEYANKIKSTTQKSYGYPYGTVKSTVTTLEIRNPDNKEVSASTENAVTEHTYTSPIEGAQGLNDTVKRNKFYNSNTDDRNGWVTLEAIPWSKSKISKWQANPSSQRPWPEATKWDKPTGASPWNLDYPSRPQQENNRPWYGKPKPSWSEYEQDRPQPIPPPARPSSYNDRYDTSLSQAQKWPPERPSSSWEAFPHSHRPTGDIITDNKPSNFPTNSWNKYDQLSKPSYSSLNDRYGSNNHQEETNHDWPSNHYSSKLEDMREKPSSSRPTSRPYFPSNYEYEDHHPPSHPSSGDGQWVLLSTNRGYSKNRQRSIKFEPQNDESLEELNATSNTIKILGKVEDPDPSVPVLTSKRQVRLTVLPSINGTNTTTSHGGLLEVEKTFQTVDQSQEEYEAAQKLSKAPTMIKKRPIRNTIIKRPSNSAVLAAVGAGMLPATMAMMIPIVLGRKKRSFDPKIHENLTVYLPEDSNNANM